LITLTTLLEIQGKLIKLAKVKSELEEQQRRKDKCG